MSKPSANSLLLQVTELTAQFAALKARLDTLIAPAPVAVKKQRAKKEKKPRDPDAPKRAPGAYLLFCQAERTKTPDIKLKISELAERWRNLSADEKASYKPALPEVEPASKTTFDEVRQVAATMNSNVAAKFMRFCVKNPTLDAKTAESRWKQLAPEQKAEFNYDGDTTDDDSTY